MRFRGPYAVEKLEMLEIRRKLGDRKCLPESRKSLVGRPNAMQFLRIYGQ